ncbi:MAG: branched-chain amino acid ABC transporter ATP-binding protein/permease [Actinobacteria bacterium]|nr:branched-chain amino acid ABC transporter ATP-binding protein/permease [Actinomycetota bacterium]
MRRVPVWLVATVVCAALPPVLGRAGLWGFDQYHALILCFGLTYALAALPLNLLMGYAGQISLGHAAFLGLGAFASGIIAGRLGLPFTLGLLVSAVVGALAALVIGLPALRLRGLYLALVTLGFGLAMASMVFRLRSVTGGYAGQAVPRPQAGSFVFLRNADLLSIIVVVFGLVWALDRNLLRTKVGRGFLALREDEEVAAAFGVDVPLYKLYAFGLYGAISSIAGSVFGHVVGFAQQESFTFDLSLLFVVIVLIGGLRSRPGVATAAFFFGVMPRFFTFLKGWELVIAPAIVMLTLVRHPGGLGQTFAEVKALRTRGRKGRRVAVEDDESDTASASLVLPRPAFLHEVADTATSSRKAEGTAAVPLEVRDVSVRFGGLVAVDNASITVESGRITGLIGPNGAGKSTLFNAISGFVRPTQGRVLLHGADITGLPPHRRAALGIGRTFQQIGLVKDLTVTENLLLAQHRLADYGSITALAHLPAVGRGERALRERAAETLHALQFERFAQSELRELSHGQQRIVELAAALLTAPGVLLLDEPSAGMSPAAAEALAERLLQVRDELGQTILLIEHHLPLVLATCTTVHVMDAGRMLTSGPPTEVVTDPSVVAAYLGERVA